MATENQAELVTTSTEAAEALHEQDKANMQPGAIRPMHSFWPSKLGHPCLRHLWYWRTVPDQAAGKREGLEEVFWLGRNLEDPIANRVENAAKKLGWSIRRLGRTYIQVREDFGGSDKWPMPKIGGYLDRILDTGRPRGLVVEIKGLSHVLEKVDHIMDFLARPQPWLRSYPYQIWSYEQAAFEGGYTERDGMLTLLDKLSGRVKFIPAPFNEELFRVRWQGLRMVEAMVRGRESAKPSPWAMEGPPAIDYDPHCCESCEFNHVCLPAKSGGEVPKCVGEEMQKLIARRMELEPTAKEFDTLDKTIKAGVKRLAPWQAGGKASMLAGDVVVRVSHSETTTYAVPDEIKQQYKGKSQRTTVKFETVVEDA